MIPVACGVETEYGAVAHRGNCEPVERQEAIALRLSVEIPRRFRHLPGANSSGVFTDNGCRIYVDCGHLEVSTPECSTPADVVRYVLAGDRMAGELGRACRLLIFRNNVDYHHATWGSHESYLYRCPPPRLHQHLLPFLVSRPIIAGAGGFHPTSPGIEFTLSPRSTFLRQAISDHSTHARGIVHTRDEPLAGPGWRRLHLICGEGLQSHKAMWLRIGCTLLVVLMIDAGREIVQEVQLKDPVEALKIFISDPDCRATAMAAEDRRLSAIDIQHHYLYHAESFVESSEMAGCEWAAQVCAAWRETLDQLERGPGAVGTTLDWAIKLELYRSHAERRGIPWSSLPAWSRVLRGLPALAGLGAGLDADSAELACLPTPPLRSILKTLRSSPAGCRSIKSRVEEAGLRADDLDRVVDLRAELLEIDTRFSQIEPAGIFAALDRAGVLTHRVPGIDRIDDAIGEPPPGRAQLRGQAIRQLAQAGTPGTAEWTGVWDLRARRYLDLQDPFGGRPEWKPSPAPTPGHASAGSAR